MSLIEHLFDQTHRILVYKYIFSNFLDDDTIRGITTTLLNFQVMKYRETFYGRETEHYRTCRKVVVCVVDDDLDYYIRYSKDMV